MDIFYFLSQIERLCRERGITKAEFYKKAGITASAVSQWRKKKTVPAETTIQKIAEAFEVDVAILTGEKEKSAPETGDGLEEEFIWLFRDLSPEEKVREVAFLRERAAGRDK